MRRLQGRYALADEGSEKRSRFNETDEFAYLKRRLQDEREAAERATDSQARTVHGQLADLFAQRIAAFGVNTAPKSDDTRKRNRRPTRQ
jgi:hypothetical protein